MGFKPTTFCMASGLWVRSLLSERRMVERKLAGSTCAQTSVTTGATGARLEFVCVPRITVTLFNNEVRHLEIEEPLTPSKMLDELKSEWLLTVERSWIRRDAIVELRLPPEEENSSAKMPEALAEIQADVLARGPARERQRKRRKEADLRELP
jgi:hypothetical protein